MITHKRITNTFPEYYTKGKLNGNINIESSQEGTVAMAEDSGMAIRLLQSRNNSIAAIEYLLYKLQTVDPELATSCWESIEKKLQG